MVRIGALFAMVLLGGCWPPCEPYGYETTDTRTIREDDPAEASVIAACFANDALCERLCTDLLGPPPAETIRSIEECIVNRDGTGGLRVFSRAHLVQKCVDDWTGDDVVTWYPDAQQWLDGRLWDFDATPPDAEPAVDATPPDGGL